MACGENKKYTTCPLLVQLAGRETKGRTITTASCRCQHHQISSSALNQKNAPSRCTRLERLQWLSRQRAHALHHKTCEEAETGKIGPMTQRAVQSQGVTRTMRHSTPFMLTVNWKTLPLTTPPSLIPPSTLHLCSAASTNHCLPTSAPLTLLASFIALVFMLKSPFFIVLYSFFSLLFLNI